MSLVLHVSFRPLYSLAEVIACNTLSLPVSSHIESAMFPAVGYWVVSRLRLLKENKGGVWCCCHQLFVCAFCCNTCVVGCVFKRCIYWCSIWVLIFLSTQKDNVLFWDLEERAADFPPLHFFSITFIPAFIIGCGCVFNVFRTMCSVPSTMSPSILPHVTRCAHIAWTCSSVCHGFDG